MTRRLPPLIAIRHAKTLTSGLCYGRTDVPAPVPPAEAVRLRRRLRRILSTMVGSPRVISSPRVRCLTVSHLLEPDYGSFSIDERIAELDFGAFEGRLYSELSREPEFMAWMNDYRTARPPEGESLADFQARVAASLATLEAEGCTGPVLLVTHAGVIRLLRHLVLRQDLDAALTSQVPYLRPQIL